MITSYPMPMVLYGQHNAGLQLHSYPFMHSLGVIMSLTPVYLIQSHSYITSAEKYCLYTTVQLHRVGGVDWRSG